jgi:protocatechuate 3,4-dioxygenase alpha subunit
MSSGQTPSQTVGPFFNYGMFTRPNLNVLVNDLTHGERIHVIGQVIDGDGTPVGDAVIEIWQPDANGIFNHPDDPRHADADPNFRGFGRSETVDNGRFSFKTIKPGTVPFDEETMQAPYLSIKVFARGMLIHASTRLYFSDEPANATDPVLGLVEADRRHTLIAQRIESDDLTTYCFNIVLQGDGETVFFDP